MSNPAIHSDDDEFKDQEYAANGGWLTAVANLIRWLRAASCWEYAHKLERDVQSVSMTPPPEVEKKALAAIFRSLGFLWNNPPSHLTSEQRKELKPLRRMASRFAQYRLRQIAEEIDARNHLVHTG